MVMFCVGATAGLTCGIVVTATFTFELAFFAIKSITFDSHEIVNITIKKNIRVLIFNVLLLFFNILPHTPFVLIYELLTLV